MKLSINSPLVKWAYFMALEGDIPTQTNVCALFWRSFLLTPMKLLGMGGILIIFGPVILWSWAQEKGYTEVLERPIHIRLPRLRFPSLPRSGLTSLAWQRAKDWKSGVCTIVEIK